MILRSTRIALVAMFATIAAIPTSAQIVEVRSGDHPGYARLVLDFPGAPPTWELRRDRNGYVLSLAPPDIRLDTTDVFRLIDRDRIADVIQAGPGAPLAISVACDCHADAFEFRGRSLVIDIQYKYYALKQNSKH